MTEVKNYAMTCEAIKKYSFRLDADGNILEEITDPLDIEGMLARAINTGSRAKAGDDALAGAPSEQLDALAWDYQYAHPDLSWRQCLTKVMSANPAIVRAYGHEHQTRPRIYSEDAHPQNDPAEEIHEKATALVERGKCDNYSEAVTRVLKSNPRLQQRWASFASCGG